MIECSIELAGFLRRYEKELDVSRFATSPIKTSSSTKKLFAPMEFGSRLIDVTDLSTT